ncbi:phosphomethylpyrimidine kinase THI20 [Apiospora rasikravindrae]|uniref:Phosphomethylpyrimidine kinase THI20 n=1 Tax=Apiospora rasikravindrae TaxID=990691 RepID=A0ABR1RWC4_9PEZI
MSMSNTQLPPASSHNPELRGRVLLVAGSDSSGGAGLEADQKVLAAHGCYAMTATTALTAQNTLGVDDIYHIPADFVRKQIDAVFKDIKPDVIKTGESSPGNSIVVVEAQPLTCMSGSGMLASAETIGMVAKAFADFDVNRLVLDPVMVATTGKQLLPPDAVHDLRELLLPQTFIVTPNIPEAMQLLTLPGQQPPDVQNVDDLEDLGRKLLKLGPEWVLVKGGHTPFKADGTVAQTDEEKELVYDVLVGADSVTRIKGAYQKSKNTHGTGCSLASAMAANLSMGLDPVQAVKAACAYVEAAIRFAPGYGEGNGPLNHFHSMYTLPFAPDRFVDYLLDRPDVAPVWHKFVNHPFVLAMGSGELPQESFKNYLIQDYLYLVHFARANALASYKAKSMEDIAAGAKIVTHINTEMSLHIDYCASFGISKEQIVATEEHQACTAYTRYVLDVGMSSDWLALQVALAPCLLGYGAIGQALHDEKNKKTKREGNTYYKWICNYVAEDYVEAVRTGRALMERHASGLNLGQVEELVKIFIHGTKVSCCILPPGIPKRDLDNCERF